MGATIGLLVLLAAGVIAAVILIGSNSGASSADAARALDEVVDDADFDATGVAQLATCPIAPAERLLDDVIERIDDRRLDTLERDAPGIEHESLVIDYPDNDVQVVVCERLGTDPNINLVGVSASRAPDDVLAYLSELTGVDDVVIDDEPDPDDRRGPVVRWVCIDTDEVEFRFCEALWDDQELMLTIYVGGASSARISTDTLRDVLLDSVDDWTEALADRLDTDDAD